jgi:hypothetical protein
MGVRVHLLDDGISQYLGISLVEASVPPWIISVKMMALACRRGGLLGRTHLARHRGNELGGSGVDGHCVLQHFVGDIRVHDVEAAVNGLVAGALEREKALHVCVGCQEGLKRENCRKRKRSGLA